MRSKEAHLLQPKPLSRLKSNRANLGLAGIKAKILHAGQSLTHAGKATKYDAPVGRRAFLLFEQSVQQAAPCR
jgi:hypothetical protein